MIQSAQQPVVIAWDDTARRAIEALRQAGAIQPIAPERWGEQGGLNIQVQHFEGSVLT
ncbi:hypothetical protein [Vandammella animalimorsus]|uniref:hypothetical protein n=1 Tax=Vandammella animalimorsus TaxID=2029117 RepID=UPI001EEF65E8|nr:hypothetical protein [Vandammella animalimorsus]